MEQIEILAIIEELKAYDDKGPAVKRRTCGKAAELIERAYIRGEQQSLVLSQAEQEYVDRTREVMNMGGWPMKHNRPDQDAH